jgi:hypothetical protein
MEVMHRRVAGLDVHKETVVACVRVMAGRRPTRAGVYWVSVWKIPSEGDFTLIVANAAQSSRCLAARRT